MTSLVTRFLDSTTLSLPAAILRLEHHSLPMAMFEATMLRTHQKSASGTACRPPNNSPGGEFQPLIAEIAYLKRKQPA